MAGHGAAYRSKSLDRQRDESGIPKRGLTLANSMHITASVFINDDEYGLHQDYEKWLEELAPHGVLAEK